MNAVPWWKEPTRAQWTTFAAAWFGWIVDAFDFTIFFLAKYAIEQEFGVSGTAMGFVIAATLLARLVGGVIAGKAADRWGRKLPFLISMVWLAAFDGAVALAPSFAAIAVLRILFGVGMGAEWTSGTTLAMENWPVRTRAIASGVLQGSWAVGYLVACLVYPYVMGAWGWRGLFWLAALPALAVLPLRLWVKESEEWKRQANAPKSAAPAAKLAVGRLAWASTILGLGFAVYYSLAQEYPKLLVAELGKSVADVGFYGSLFNVGMMTGAVACGVLSMRRGVVTAVAAPALLSLLVLPLYVGIVPSALGVGAFLAGMIGVGWSGVVPAFLTSLFPAQVRGSAVGITYHVGAVIGAFTGPLMVPALAEWGPVRALAAEFGATPLGMSILVVASVFQVLLAVGLLATRGRAEPAAADVPAAVPQPWKEAA